MGRHVAADADLSLRLVASAATKQDLCQVEPHACGTRPEKQELSRSRKRDGADLAATPSAVVLRERVTTRTGGHRRQGSGTSLLGQTDCRQEAPRMCFPPQ